MRAYKKKVIAITLGDVAGIGPEVVRKALNSGKLNSKFEYHVLLSQQQPKVVPGKISSKAAKFALESLQMGVQGCLNGDYSALVTAPVHKACLHRVGFQFPGQTEWLTHQTGARRSAMMLVGGNLRVSLVTIHEPLMKVGSLLSVRRILEVIELTHTWLLQFGIRNPKIAVAALNPHGGVPEEQGEEERKIIIPAVRKARKQWGTRISGPHSPDAIFREAYLGKVSAVVCMYHDQGLIPLKMVGFDQGVNLTLGLPLIRTSPDHGTAYDLAGKNQSRPDSMIEAINLAAQLATRHSVSRSLSACS